MPNAPVQSYPLSNRHLPVNRQDLRDGQLCEAAFRCAVRSLDLTPAGTKRPRGAKVAGGRVLRLRRKLMQNYSKAIKFTLFTYLVKISP